VRAAAITAFDELAKKLDCRAKLSEVPSGMEGALRSAARVDLQAPTVAAAFWRSAAAFELVPFLLGEMPPPSAKASRFCSWLPEHTEAMRHVVRRIVELLFVRILIQMRGLRYGVQVAWSELPDEALFLVPWRLRQVEGSERLELRVRTWVDGNVIGRLASRYRRSWLLKAPEDASIVALVSGEVASGPMSSTEQGKFTNP
jgi:hypothetical protein